MGWLEQDDADVTDEAAEAAVAGMPREDSEDEVTLSAIEIDQIATELAEGQRLGLEFNLETPDDGRGDLTQEQLEAERLQGMRAIYGEDFPLAVARATGVEPSGENWVTWGKNTWDRHAPALQRRMHEVTQLRLFREGKQWLTEEGVNRWGEPPRATNSVRTVHNLFAPALDQRANLLSEQRPGFRTRPRNQDVESLKKAEGRQLALEFQYDQQGMAAQLREASYWNGTDGVAFWLTYWDADAGPWHEERGEAPIDPATGQPTGGPQPVTKRYPLGEVTTRTLRTEQVVVSANASATRKPYYICIRERIPLSEAVAFHGVSVANESEGASGDSDTGFSQTGVFDQYGNRQDDLVQGQDTVERYIIFCEKSEFLPDGLTAVIVGDRCVMVSELLCGKVPVVRVPDGSTDPKYFPKAEATHWRDHQIRINAILSKWFESVAHNAGGRFAYRAKAINLHDLVGGSFTGVEVRAPGPIRDSLVPIPPFSVAADAKELLALAIKAFEEVSGYNAASRGQFSGGASGRAILASREGIERIYAPAVNAAARAMTEWADITMAWMRWGYDMPRRVQVVGSGRMDLALALESETFEPDSVVEIDPQTLMPMPEAYKQFQLDQYLEKDVIDIKEYRQRQPFAFIGNMDRPADQHTARAKRVAAMILQGVQPDQLPPIRWQDDEALHQDVLEAEVILRDELDPMMIEIAHQRWVALAKQAAAKNPMGAPMGGAPAGGPAGGKGSPFKPGPEKQPLMGMDPAMAAAPQAEVTGFQGGRMAGDLFDRSRVS